MMYEQPVGVMRALVSLLRNRRGLRVFEDN